MAAPVFPRRSGFFISIDFPHHVSHKLFELVSSLAVFRGNLGENFALWTI